MAFPTSVNSQITDAVTQASRNSLTVQESLNQAFGCSLTLALKNATAAQQNLNILSQAVTTKCIEKLLGEK